MMPGLYASNSGYQDVVYSWQELIDNEIIQIENNTLYTNYDEETQENINSNLLAGDLVISSDITGIGNHAFYECNSPTSITIPELVTNIGDNAFFSCAKLSTVNFKDTSTWYYKNSSNKEIQLDVSNATQNAKRLSGVLNFGRVWYKK